MSFIMVGLWCESATLDPVSSRTRHLYYLTIVVGSILRVVVE